MRKIKTLFKKDRNDLSKVTKEFDDDFIWVVVNSTPMQKLDGTACKIIKGRLYKRYDAKINVKTRKYKKAIPIGAIPCCEADLITGHHPHWIECREDNPSDRWHMEAYNNICGNAIDGTYELIGEKIQGNPEKIKGHRLVNHKDKRYVLAIDITKCNDYDYVKNWLKDKDIEGIVFHSMQGEMCKIRKKDFGIDR